MKPSDRLEALYAGQELTTVEQDVGQNLQQLFTTEYGKTLEALVAQASVQKGESLSDAEIFQIRTDLDNELSRGLPTSYNAMLTPATLPLETQVPSSETISQVGLGEALSRAVGRQQTVGEVRTTIMPPATYDPRSDLNTKTKDKLVELYTKSRTPEASVLSPEELDRINYEAREDARSLTYAYDELGKRFPSMTPEQRYEEVINALADMDKVPTVRESAVDPAMKAKFKGEDWYDKLAQALEGNIQEGGFKAYSPVQQDILSYQVKNKIRTNVDFLYPKMAEEIADLVVVQTDGEGTIVMPREVFDYIGEDGLGAIFSNEKDLAIRKAYKGESGQYRSLIGSNKKTIKESPQPGSHALSLAKVRAYQQEDYDWTVDPDRRDFILENLDDFKTEGWFTDQTVLGGVTETPTSWFLRNAFMVPNVLTGVVIRGAKDVADVGIELATGEEDVLRKATLEERQKNAPLFADDSIVSDLTDAIARNKGFVDESEVIINAFDIQDPYGKYAVTGGLFVLDLLNPDLDVIAGVAKGTQSAARVVQANRKLYGTGTVNDFLAPKTYTLSPSEFGKALSDEVLDSTNLISITNNTIKKVKGTPVDNLVYGDIRLRMGDQVANSLEAKRLLDKGLEDEILQQGLDNTPYYQQVQKVGKAQADEMNFGNIQKNETASKLLDEYESAQRFVDDIETKGYETALRFAKDDPTFNVKTVDDIIKSQNPLPVKDMIPTLRRGLSTVYGRSILFEMTPALRSLESIVEVTPRLFAGKKIAKELQYVASQSDIGQRFGRLSQLPFGENIKPAQTTAAELFGDTVTKEGRVTKFFDLSQLSVENKSQLVNDLDALKLNNTERIRIAENIDNNLMYADDLRKIIDRNIERALLTDGRVATLDDINRLANVEQRRLLEAADTVARQSSRGIIDIVKESFANIDDKLPQQIKQTTTKLVEPQIKVRKALGFKANRILRKVDGQISNLELRAEREYKRFIEDGMSGDQAIAKMIVGEPQDLIGNYSKRNNIGDALLWMTDQMFTRVKIKQRGPQFQKSTSPDDLVSGYDKLLCNDVFSGHGVAYRNYLVNEFVEELIDNPDDFWIGFQALIQELNNALKDPNGFRTFTDSTGEVLTGRVRNINVEAEDILLGKGKPLEDIMPEVSLGAYMATEIRRITKEVIVDEIDENLVQIAAKNVFPGLNISQDQYADMLRLTTELMYTNREQPFSEIIAHIKVGISTTFGREIPEVAAGPLGARKLDDVARTMYDQSETVLRNNRLLNSSTQFGPQELSQRLDQLFGEENETLFKALVGQDLYDEMKEVVNRRGYGFVQEEISKVLKTNSNFYDALGFIQNALRSTFYTLVLGGRVAYHVVNTVSAPAIIYQTIGTSKLFPDTKLYGLFKRSYNTVTQGANKGSRMYADIALRTQDGKVYTYGDLFEALQKTGAKTEYTYIKSALRDGTLLKDIRLATMNRSGIGRRASYILQNFSRRIGKIGDAATNFATAQDMMFRAAVLVNALDEGRSLDEAAKLASRSMFDYNDMPNSFRKTLNGAFVFTSFAYANNIDLLRAFLGMDAGALKRYAYVAKTTRDTNKFFSYLNDNQEYPYEMYFPDFAQPRFRFGYQADPDGRGASFKMGMSIPSNEAIQFWLSVLDAGYRKEFAEPVEYITNMLDPTIKNFSDMFLGTNFKRIGMKVPLKHVYLFALKYDSPAEIAKGIETVTGTQVYPKFVGFDAKQNYNGYIFEFKDTKQRNVYVSNFYVIASSYGIDSLSNAYLRAAAPQGSAYMGQSPLERLGGALGFYSPARMETPSQQQVRAVRKHITELRKVRNRAERLTMDELMAPDPNVKQE